MDVSTGEGAGADVDRVDAAELSSQIRVARPTGRLREVAAFYGDGLGLARIDGFEGHGGLSGIMFGLPGARFHLEFTSRDGETQDGVGHAPTRDNLLVFYMPDSGAAAAVSARLTAMGHAEVAAENPYWTARAARTHEDPDGWRVVLVPSAYA